MTDKEGPPKAPEEVLLTREEELEKTIGKGKVHLVNLEMIGKARGLEELSEGTETMKMSKGQVIEE